MVDKALTLWIERVKARGYNNASITKYLLAKGHSPQVVAQAIAEVEAENEEAKKPRTKAKAALAIFGLVFLAFLTAATIIYILPQPESQQQYLVDEEPEFRVATGDEEQVSTPSQKLPPGTCQSQLCFEEKFSFCEPAKYTMDVSDDTSIFLNVLQEDGRRCAVTWKYVTHPNANFVNKPITCKYDNKQDLNIALTDYSQCSGPLYEALGG